MQTVPVTCVRKSGRVLKGFDPVLARPRRMRLKVHFAGLGDDGESGGACEQTHAAYSHMFYAEWHCVETTFRVDLPFKQLRRRQPLAPGSPGQLSAVKEKKRHARRSSYL